ncbi:syntaxin-6-like protein [Paraphysoderma sedebokerense]|nr:syntaxin-6-like protein [Paraphysoderma sedebokerense]
MQDPFYAVKEEVQTSLQNAQAQFSSWQRLSSTNNHSSEFQRVAAEVRNAIQNIELDLQDLSETVRIVEKTPERFNLDHREVQSRKAFINSTQQSLQDMKDSINSGLAAAANSQRDALFKSNKPIQDKYSRSNQIQQADNQRFIEDESSRQQMLIRNQDQQLDGVLNTVSTLKNVALTMGQELDDQVRLLHEVDEQVDGTQTKLKTAMNKVNKILKESSDTKSSCCIGILIVILVILLILVII